MPLPDYRGARGSNAGDDFHELWALRQALSLLDHDAALSGIAAEGLTSEDQSGVPSDTWDGVDCALYYEGDSAATAKRIEVVQFKYSSAAPNTKWTTAKLTSNSSTKGNNSVLRRMGTMFSALKRQRNDSPTGITIHLVSNQPSDDRVAQILAVASSGGTLSGDDLTDYEALRTASGLNKEDFSQLAAALDLSQTGSRFALQEDILRTIAGWVESDARPLVDTLLRFMRSMMMPERSGEWITLNTILAQLGFGDRRAIFPCPAQFAPSTSFIQRKISSDVVEMLKTGSGQVCIHGTGGSGKTTVLREIRSLLPTDSKMIIFDCYGAGRYLDSDAYRHRAKDAFLQITNELAGSLRVPLLLTRSDAIDYPRAFKGRLEQAAEALANQNNGALLVLAVDAADNSFAAARSFVPPEQSFVADFVKLGTLPGNVRVVITTRTGGLPMLNLPSQFKLVGLPGFTPEETKAFVHSHWPAAPQSWIDDFHYHSFQTPRVQYYALSQCGTDFKQALSFLLPSGKQLSDIFEKQIVEARTKIGAIEPVKNFCAALSALPHPVPIDDLAAISGLSVAAANDLCADLAPGVRIGKDGIGFGDEDFETFIRAQAQQGLSEAQKHIAERFWDRRNVDPYAARHLASALYSAGRGKELVSLTEKEPAPTAIVDPVVKREVRFERMRIAMKACSDVDDESAMLRTLLAGAQAMRGEDVINGLINDYPDLAAAFMREGAARTVLVDSRKVANHGPLLFHILREDSIAQNAIAAREDGRQLNAWLVKRNELVRSLREDGHHKRAWNITSRDIASEIEAAIILRGPAIAIEVLKRWEPRSAQLEVADILCTRPLRANIGETNPVWLIKEQSGKENRNEQAADERIDHGVGSRGTERRRAKRGRA